MLESCDTAPRRNGTLRAGWNCALRQTIARRMDAETPRRLRFGQGARIKQGRDFARARLDGERLVVGCLIANWQRLPEGSPSRLGVVTSGKVGNAVARNRARRLL